MDREQVHTLLATRASLTGQPYGDRSVDEWHGVLVGAPFAEARLAVVAAAKDSNRVGVADVLARLPRKPPVKPADCELCQSTGWVETAPHPGRPCMYPARVSGACFCHAVKPCRCPIGTQQKVPQP